MKSDVKCFDCRKTALVTLFDEFFKCTHCGIYGFRFTAAGKDRLKIQDRDPQPMGNVGDLLALAMGRHNNKLTGLDRSSAKLGALKGLS